MVAGPGKDEERITVWAVGLAFLGVIMLLVGRFITYIQVVTENDVGFTSALTWWGMYAIALGLIVAGMVKLARSKFHARAHEWAIFLVGVLVLVLMPTAPWIEGFPWESLFNGMWGP